MLSLTLRGSHRHVVTIAWGSTRLVQQNILAADFPNQQAVGRNL